MKNTFQYAIASALVLACAVLSGCETQPTQVAAPKPVVKPKEVPAPQAAPAPAEPPPVPAYTDAQALKDGMALYDGGDYNGAIKKLNTSTEIWNGHNKAIQVNAIKIMAFSYCVTSKIQLCRQQFDRALKLDPSFTLLPSEIGHPIWGPVFLKSKNAVKSK
jgi:hypothetical protein